jgi:hypothetical protein
MMGNKRIIFFSAIVMLFLILPASACGNGRSETEKDHSDESTSNISEDTSAVSESSNANPEEASPPAVINPLTGQPAADPELLNRRPVMVKVSNFPREGRPHAGLSSADIVFDYFIGYGTNRFLALYYGQDTYKIGPVRSGRRVDAELVTMYDGVLAYGSADEDTDVVLVTALGEYALSHLEAECPVFCGIDTHSATGVFANSEAISAYMTALGLENGTPDLPGMVFAEQPPADSQPADQLTILFNYYNRGEWRYDDASRKYLRWIESVENEGESDEDMQMIPLTDRVTGEQLAFSNIIVLFAHYNELAPSAHEIDIWGNNSGLPAYLFRDGGMTQGEWASENDADPLQFFNPDGSPMVLKPGNTWIAIMGLSSLFDEVEPGKWETFFFLP